VVECLQSTVKGREDAEDAATIEALLESMASIIVGDA